MHHDQDEKKSATFAYVASFIVAVVVLVVLYFASLGPVACALDLNNSADGVRVTIWTVYSYPGQLLYDAGYGDWLSEYVEWWIW